MLCRTRNDRWQKILVPQRRYLVLWNHYLRHALWIPPLLRSQHQQTLQKNYRRRLLNAESAHIRGKGHSPQRAERESGNPLQNSSN